MKLNFAPEKVNPEQRAAMAAVDGPSLVIAGPGSGKTTNLDRQGPVHSQALPRRQNSMRNPYEKGRRRDARENREKRTLAQFTYPRSTHFATDSQDKSRPTDQNPFRL